MKIISEELAALQAKIFEDLEDRKFPMEAVVLDMYVHMRAQSIMLARMHSLLEDLYNDLSFLDDEDSNSTIH